MPKIDGRTLDHGTSEHIRILAVRRVREDKEKPSEVIKSLGLCRTTIYRWLRMTKGQAFNQNLSLPIFSPSGSSPP
jgi:hypothetical protein